MSAIKRLFQHVRPSQKPAAAPEQEHPNFWMYQ
jgi:hypothetical protein